MLRCRADSALEQGHGHFPGLTQAGGPEIVFQPLCTAAFICILNFFKLNTFYVPVGPYKVMQEISIQVGRDSTNVVKKSSLFWNNETFLKKQR